jgi:hypothetical protein
MKRVMEFSDFAYNVSTQEWEATEGGLNGLDVGLGYVGDTVWARTHTLTTAGLVERFPDRKAEIADKIAEAEARSAKAHAEYEARRAAALAEPEPEYW